MYLDSGRTKVQGLGRKGKPRYEGALGTRGSLGTRGGKVRGRGLGTRERPGYEGEAWV